MSITINLGFDEASLARLRKLEGFDSWLATLYMQEAMPKSLDELEQASQATMLASFQDPTGRIETKFRKRVSSPWKGILGNYEPYGQRLEKGFSGMTDALGRYYAAWPANSPDGYHWMERGAEMATPYVEAHFREATQTAIDEVSA